MFDRVNPDRITLTLTLILCLIFTAATSISFFRKVLSDFRLFSKAAYPLTHKREQVGCGDGAGELTRGELFYVNVLLSIHVYVGVGV